jgi:CheY-like chemotaxis protein
VSGRDSLAGIHVLVVDDEDDARDLITIVLRESGATVTAESSVAAAMEILTVSPISVVVSDSGCPCKTDTRSCGN